MIKIKKAKYIYIVNQGEFLLEKIMEFVPANEGLMNKEINKCVRQVKNFKTLIVCKMCEGEVFGEEELLGVVIS